jgi:TolB-like protein/tetratricopeptide (TPR) repeat protein
MTLTEAKASRIYLAVLPLEVLADDAGAEMFCQGLVMDVIGDLSRFRSLNIVAPESAGELGSGSDPGSGEKVQIDYLVKGIARHHDGHLQVNLQLINYLKKSLVWAEKFSGEIDDLFRIQGEIVERIVLSLQSFVEHDLLEHIRHKPLTSLSAYESWLRGFKELKEGTLEADEQARIYFRQALAQDPHFVRAYTGMSLTYFNEWSCQLWNRWDVSQNGASEWAKMALEHDEWDHMSNAILGRVYVYNEDWDQAEHFLRKSLRINQNDPRTLAMISSSWVYMGYLSEALSLYERAQRLNPAHSYAVTGSFVYFEMGEFEKAVELAEQQEISEVFIDFSAYQSAMYFHLGDFEKMTASWQTFVEIFSQTISGGRPSDPQTALEWMINVNPYRGETQLMPFWEHISKVDLDEVVARKHERHTSIANRLVKEGELWSVRFRGTEARLPDLKGLHDLVRLLERPREQIHCTDLMGAAAVQRGEEVLDDRAKAEYQQRILDLQEGIEEAEANRDDDRLEVLHLEYDQLLDHLSKAVGKGGKTRKVESTVEKSRTAVTWRIRSAVKKISDVHPTLGIHLKNAVKTGVFCEYAPEHDTTWET